MHSAWRADGRHAYLLTLTVRHGWGDDLETMHADLMAAFKRMQQGRAWQEFRERFGVEMIRSVEVTHGPNGWHPHIHCMLMTRECLPYGPQAPPWAISDHPPPGSLEWFKLRWESACIDKMAAKHCPDRIHGVTLFGTTDASKYLSKLSLELTDPTGCKTTAAGHRHPWEILAAAGVEDEWQAMNVRLWQTYARAMAGRRFVAYTRGLRPLRDVIRKQLAVDAADAMARAEHCEVIWHDVWDRCRFVPWFRAAVLTAVESGERWRYLEVLRKAEIAAAAMARERERKRLLRLAA